MLLALANVPAELAAAQAAAGMTAAPAGDAFRVTALLPDQAGAVIYEARRSGGRSERTQIDLAPGPPGNTVPGWTVARRDTRYLAGETFDYIAAQIDGATGGVAAAECAAAPAFLIEHGGRRAIGCGFDGVPFRIARALGLVEDKDGSFTP